MKTKYENEQNIVEKREKKKTAGWKKVVAFVLIFLVLFKLLSDVMQVNDYTSMANIRGFYLEPENSLDVVLIGSSEFYADYSATQAWKEYGYTSYSLAIGGIPGNMYKSMTAESLKKQSPKLVVFELNGFLQGNKYFERQGKLHTWLDNIPWSVNKIETIKEMIPKEEWYSYFCKFATYHENWKDLKECGRLLAVKGYMMMQRRSYTKGFGTYTKISDTVAGADSKKIKFTKKSEAYLKGLLAYCKEQGLENVLFVRFPHQRKIENPEDMERIQKLVEDSGYDYLNLNEEYDAIGLDRSKDFYDREHLNVYGMEKMTKYFGNYLCSNYEIKGSYTEDQIAIWNDCAAETKELIDRCKEDLENGVDRRYCELSTAGW